MYRFLSGSRSSINYVIQGKRPHLSFSLLNLQNKAGASHNTCNLTSITMMTIIIITKFVE
jgi:hypothetical protein